MASIFPHFRFFHPEADEEAEQRRQSSDKKHRPPTPAREDKEETARRQQVAESVSLLQDAGEKAAQAGRNFLHGERSAYSPLSAHADAEQGAQHQDASETVRETSGHFDHGVENEVDHQGNAAPVTIGHQSKDER